MAFASLREGIDSSTNTGRLVFHLFAALAEFEPELIADRAAVGRAAAAARPTDSLPSRPGSPALGTRTGTSPRPKLPRRWGSAGARSTGRSSRHPDLPARRG
ncbi:recombinase family protein [Kribbella sp. NBC_00359]|uniref:recombinase family protein n=1 Tax=Kribbella sp. NBC_00359 TaxID=2975966 RepID=UPI003FA55C6A